MSGDDTFCSSSGSLDQPFHSTPVKTKVQFVSTRTLIEASSSSSDSEISKHTSESQGGRTTAGTLTKSLSSSALNTADSTLDDAETHSQARVPTSAWEQWFLKKEKERRKELHIQIELKQKQRENEKLLMQVKIRQKKASQEHYSKWLNTKNLELKQQADVEKHLKAKKDLDAKVARERTKQMTEIQLKKWKDRKLEEKKSKVQNYGQENALSPEDVEEHRRKCDSAFKQWLKEHRNYYREHYSYGYSGGVVVSYYDLTSLPRPTFFNPEPWIS